MLITRCLTSHKPRDSAVGVFNHANLFTSHYFAPGLTQHADALDRLGPMYQFITIGSLALPLPDTQVMEDERLKDGRTPSPRLPTPALLQLSSICPFRFTRNATYELSGPREIVHSSSPIYIQFVLFAVVLSYEPINKVHALGSAANP